MSLVERPPKGLLRAVLRAPVYLYRTGLGWLLGKRFLYLAHRGRTSGLRRDVVLEVVHFDERAPEAVVVAAWGARSDWFRNISASPPIEVRVGRRRWVSPRHRVLEPTEVMAVFEDYARRHPRAWRALAPRIGMAEEMSSAAARAAADRFPAVAFAPAGAGPGARARGRAAAGTGRIRRTGEDSSRMASRIFPGEQNLPQ